MAPRRQTEFDFDVVNQLSQRFYEMVLKENTDERHIEIIASLAYVMVGISYQYKMVSWFPSKMLCLAFDMFQQGLNNMDAEKLKQMMEENQRHGS